MGISSARWALVALALGGLALGCGGKNKKATVEPEEMQGDTSVHVPQVDTSLCEVEGKEVTPFDLNEDNKPDMWKLERIVIKNGARTAILTCQQADLNFDGKKDYVVAYNEKGTVLFEKFDLDFQKGFDAFYKYEEQPGGRESKLYEVQRDSNFNGKYDIIEKYDSNGNITEIQLDTSHDGKPDQWHQFVDGELVAILYDDKPYDGKVDRREEVITPEAKDTKVTAPPAGRGEDGNKPEPNSEQDKKPKGDKKPKDVTKPKDG